MRNDIFEQIAIESTEWDEVDTLYPCFYNAKLVVDLNEKFKKGYVVPVLLFNLPDSELILEDENGTELFKCQLKLIPQTSDKTPSDSPSSQPS